VCLIANRYSLLKLLLERVLMPHLNASKWKQREADLERAADCRTAASVFELSYLLRLSSCMWIPLSAIIEV
jgi:hypothetical protein